MRSGERGYALLIAIAVVLVLALTALSAARALGDVTTSSARLQEGSDDIVLAESVLARVAFFALTEEPGPRSLKLGDDARWQGRELMLDGRWYAIEGRAAAYLAVQDEAGLFNLNSPDQQGLEALLVLSGAREAAPGLAATLMDFTDADDLTREGGAEGREYSRNGLPAPADRPLSSQWQALEALGWREAGPSAVWEWVTAGPADVGLNINTAPRPVLEAVLGNRRRAEMVIAQREAAALTDAATLEALTAGAVRADGVTFAVAPARGFRVRAVFGSQGPLHGVERRLELGGSDAARPFRWVEEREVRLAPLRDGEAVNSLSLAPAS